MSRALLLIVALAGCNHVFGIGDLAPIADAPSGVFRKTITITSPAPDAIAELPLGILIENDPDLQLHARVGSDISFEDADGKHLGCEIVRYDASTGGLDAWVRVPSLPADPDTLKIELVYGEVATPCGGTEAWPPDARAVWHTNLAVDRTLDSTEHGTDLLTFQARGTPTDAAGIAGKALSFDGGDTLCSAAMGNGLDFGTGSFTYSLWLYERRELATYDAPFSNYGASGFVVYTGMANWSVQLSDGVSAPQLGIESELLDAWINITIVVDRDAMRMQPYRDGVAGTSLPIPALGSLTSDGLA